MVLYNSPVVIQVYRGPEIPNCFEGMLFKPLFNLPFYRTQARPLLKSMGTVGGAQKITFALNLTG